MGLSSTYLFNNLQKLKYLARTGIFVDINNLGKNTRCLAVREQALVTTLRPGVFLKKQSREFNEHSFTNIYDLYWDPGQIDLEPGIHSSDQPYFLSDQIESETNILAGINGAFFFLADVAGRKPVELPYNLCIRNSKVFGLPSYDQPIVFIKDKKLSAQKVNARGGLKIDGKRVNWVGAHSNLKEINNSAIRLFNSKSSDIIKIRDLETNIQIGLLDCENITTPRNTEVSDLVVGMDQEENLLITQINRGGGTHFFDGLFILQIKGNKHNFQIGDKVIPLSLDGLDLNGITDALTVGKAVDDGFFEEEIRVNRRDARSIIAEDLDGFIHFIVYDGSKYIPGFNGVSAKEIAPLFVSSAYKWAYFLDGGGSSRIIVKNKGKLDYFANEFSFRKIANGSVLWDWQRSRKITSSICLRLRSK